MFLNNCLSRHVKPTRDLVPFWKLQPCPQGGRHPAPISDQEWAENIDFIAAIYKKKWDVEFRESTLEGLKEGTIYFGASALKPQDLFGMTVSRPGISPEFLRRQGVFHVDREQASELLGFSVSCGGLWIPYDDPHKAGPLIVNDRPFGRLRLDKPSAQAKYLSPENAGAHLYVPISAGPPLPFGKELIIAEAEFKATSLCEAKIRAVGIGGFSSAMYRGKLIPDLAKVFAKWQHIAVVHFLGDADTVFKFDFSREAVKLAKALPAGCALKLPRIPITMPNGIDDIREQLGDDFSAFWDQITEAAVNVDRRLTAEALAVKLLASELPAISASEDKETLIQNIVELGSLLDPLNLSLMAKAAGEALDLPAADLRKTARQKAATRKAETVARKATDSAGDDVARVINDPRPKIEIPASRDRLTSEFASELGGVMARHGFFIKTASSFAQLLKELL
jgi:hypothetical protein